MTTLSNKSILLTAISTALLLGACSSTKEPTFGEKLQGQGVEVQALGKQWSEGEDMIAEGNALIKSGNKEIDKGESLISKGESKVKKGESLIKKGNRLKTEAEETYKNAHGNDSL